MLDYSNGRIYKLWSFQTDEIYIGSTIQPLCKRLAGHKRDLNRHLNGNFSYMTSFKLLEYDDCKIELIENYPCDNKNELTAREGYWIRTLECVNKYIPGRTYKEYYEDNKEKIAERTKEWRENNKDKIAEKAKEYRENNRDNIAERKKEYYGDNKEKILEKRKGYYESNKDKILQREKEYREANKDKISQREKEYYEANKDKIAEKKKEKITCQCGSIVRKSDLAKHNKSKKHQEYIHNII